MENMLSSPPVQYGSLGLAFVLSIAFVKGFFLMMAQRHELQQGLLKHHADREKAFTEQFIACIDRNSAALEKVEQSLQKIQIQLARTELSQPIFSD